MLAVPSADWARPSPCPPWSAGELLGHVLTAVARIPDMLAAPAPGRADVSAAGYYRPDERFSPRTNADRIDVARHRAGSVGSGHALAQEFDRAWRQASRLCEQEPPDRVVRTRHGDAMLLTDFLVTRVVEVGIHGLDLAHALDRRPWLTPPATRVLTGLLLGTPDNPASRALGWDDATFLRKATGRCPLTPAETEHLQRLGIRWLSLG